MEYYCIQPKLYSEFQCMGNNCPDNCCHGWGQIIWTENEYDKLCSASCSDKIKEKIGKSFIKCGKDWIINYSNNGYCAFLTEDRMCSIQRELGAEYLSSVCREYPRLFYNNKNYILRTCNSSCYHIMGMLINKEDIMTIDPKIEKINNINQIAGYHSNKETEKAKNPILKYRIDIFEFFYNIIADNSRSVEVALTLGALAAQQISKFEEKKQFDKIPMVLEAIKPQLNDPEQFKKLEAIQPNYTLKFSFVNKLLGNMYDCDFGFDSLISQGQPSKEKYDIGLKKFEEEFEDHPFALRNIVLNILTEYFISVYDKNKTVYQNYCYIVACFACIKLAAVSIYFRNKEPERDFKIISSSICRMLCHNKANVGSVLQYLKEHNCTSPAHLALLIK